MENIQLNNVDQAYEQSKILSELITNKGETLLSDLTNNILSLQAHWIGSDATTHINNLIVVKDALEALLRDGKSDVAFACDHIIAVQEVIKSNAGNQQVGTPLQKDIASVSAISKCEDTDQYYVDPAAEADKNNLVSECDAFESFITSFVADKDELLSNWTAGANRDEVVKKFNDFVENSDTYKKYMNDAKSNLEIAVSNISKLG